MVDSHVLRQGRIQKVSYQGVGRGGGGPSLTDVLVVHYLHFTECSNRPFQGHINFQGGRGSPCFKRCEGQGRVRVWRSLYLFLKKPIILVILWRGVGSGSPDSHLSMNS